MSLTASIRTLRNDYARLIEQTRRGQSVTILRHGKPVARLMPLEAPDRVDWARSAAFALKRGKRMDADAMKQVLADNRGRY
jgi:prevent-host-death family protein